MNHFQKSVNFAVKIIFGCRRGSKKIIQPVITIGGLAMEYDDDNNKSTDGDDDDNVKNKEACVRSWE